VTAACSVVEPRSSPTTAPPLAHVSKRTGRVGVILPPTAGVMRPADGAARLLAKAVEDRGLVADVATPADRLELASSAQRMIDEGADVLIVDPIDHASGVAVERSADRAGVDVIDYDHLALGGTARYYVSVDAESVGRLQAQTLIDCLAQQGITDPRVIIMDGGTDVDDGAVLMDKGVHEVLDPLVASGRATIEEEATVKGWRAVNAAPTFRVALDAAGERVDGVLAASDEIADAIIRVLAQDGLDGQVAVAGRGSGTQGLRNIVSGGQSMTMFEDPRDEAAAAAQLAAALVAGRSPSAAGLSLVPYSDPRSPGRTVTAVLLPAQVITRANVQDVVDSGALTTTEICTGITAPCAALGLQ
jgi:D-xylose transport system substrate-binding protein